MRIYSELGSWLFVDNLQEYERVCFSGAIQVDGKFVGPGWYYLATWGQGGEEYYELVDKNTVMENLISLQQRVTEQLVELWDATKPSNLLE